MKRKPPETAEQLLEQIADLFDEIPVETRAEAEEELRGMGFDPEAVGSRLEQVAHNTLAHSPLNWRVYAPKQRTRVLIEFEDFVKHVPGGPSKTEDAIRAILLQQPELTGAPSVQVYFHKFQGRASQEDLQNILAELQFLSAQVGPVSEEEGKEE